MPGKKNTINIPEYTAKDVEEARGEGFEMGEKAGYEVGNAEGYEEGYQAALQDIRDWIDEIN
jgi:flagellar biosynthesis/type III secretory pathway protein FliH